jgi:NADH-quinone oxidoreductase subunit A
MSHRGRGNRLCGGATAGKFNSYTTDAGTFPEATKESAVPAEYIPIVIFLLLAMSFPVVSLLAARLVRPNSPFASKLMPYECGIDPQHDARGRYSVRFYVVAILFVIFDVETIFLFPWAVQFKMLGLFGLIEMLVFLAILIAGYIWVYRKGALDWV